jgi:hypothetical protein
MPQAMVESDLTEKSQLKTKNVRQKKRTSAILVIVFFLFAVLGLSIAANFGVVYYIVTAQPGTRSVPGSEASGSDGVISLVDGLAPPSALSGALLDKDTGAPVTVAQSGVEVSLGLLPYLPLYAPGDALEMSPEMVTVMDSMMNTVAFRIATVGYAPPTTMHLLAMDGTNILLKGAGKATVIRTDGTNFTFCSACSTVQLKSALTNTEAFANARTAFNNAAATLNAADADRCHHEAQVGQLLLDSAVNAPHVDTLPAVCTASTEDDEDASRRRLAERRKLGWWSDYWSGVSMWDQIDADDSGKITATEWMSHAPMAALLDGQVETNDEADQVSTTCMCCDFMHAAGADNKLNFFEFMVHVAYALIIRDIRANCLQHGIGCSAWNSYSVSASQVAYTTAGACTDNRRQLTEIELAEAKRRLSHSPACPPPSSGCHPATSTLKLESGKAIRIDDVQVGDRIATPEGFEPVVGRLHADKTNSMEYYRFTTAAGTSMAVSKRHHIFANGVRTAPEKVVVGDMLTTESGAEEVATITKAYEAGVYTIITPSGTYFVDGVASTTYVAYIPYTVWRIFADGYVHLRYLLGAPIVASGEGLLPLFAQYELLEMLNLPEPLMFMLWPLTLLTTVAAELVNKVVASTPAMLTTCATATMAYKLVHGSHK